MGLPEFDPVRLAIEGGEGLEVRQPYRSSGLAPLIFIIPPGCALAAIIAKISLVISVASPLMCSHPVLWSHYGSGCRIIRRSLGFAFC